MLTSTDFASQPWTEAINAGRALPPRTISKNQTHCSTFQKPTHINRLNDSQVSCLELAFSEGNFGQFITIFKSENRADKLSEVADLINCKLTDDCPTGLKINAFTLYSAESNSTAYSSQSEAMTGTISLPVQPQHLSYIEKGQMSCLFIDVKTNTGKIFRIDILNVNHALENEYAKRVQSNFGISMPSLQMH